MPTGFPEVGGLAVATAGSATTAVDVLSQLQGASFRGIGFPSLLFDADYQHRVVRHARMDRNGVRIENTGFDGGVHVFKIPCCNTLWPGVNDTWTQPLYPGIYRQLLDALSDRSSGPFTHPDLGTRNCKVVNFKLGLDPHFRGGVTITVTLAESTDDDDDAATLTSTSTQSLGANAAAALDAAFLNLTPPPNTGTPGGQPLSTWFAGLGALDLLQLGVDQFFASIDSVLNAMGSLQLLFLGLSILDLGDQLGDGAPFVFDNLDSLISALHALRDQGLATGATTSVYVVPGDSTVAQIAGRLGNTMDQIYQLNPSLAVGLLVAAETVVTYYV